ncbi:MAG: S-layer homology domain-containing protein [Oscillospiraceae bacterium]|nr:S-layer homology domain-containing protein [Oscillospiraceae bacterium]
MNVIHIRKLTALLLALLFSALPLCSASAREPFTMSYLYGDHDYSALVERTCGMLDEVSPPWFEINSDGTLRLNAPDEAFIDRMHASGIRVVPFLSNHWDRSLGRKALANAEDFAAVLASEVEKYGLDGVNVDIENLTEADRDSLTFFAASLRRSLGPDKVLAVAAAADPEGWETGWQGSYDYAGLALYADYIMIMAYDEHYQGGEPGPVAGIGFVERSVLYALERVPAEKLVLGIPFYGRCWKNGEAGDGRGISLTGAERLMSACECRVEYDAREESVKAEIDVKPDDALSRSLKNTLAPGSYTLWCENERSIRAKLSLAKRYSLAGVGSWSLGQEPAELWLYYRAEMDGLTDVKGSDWFCACASEAVEKGLIELKDGLFLPREGMTRGEFLLALYRMEGSPAAGEDNGFADCTGRAAAWAAETGVAVGRPDGSFAPGEILSRQDAAVLACRCLLRSCPEARPGPVSAADASLIAPYALDSIALALGCGILTGGDGGLIMPAEDCTRAQAAAMLTRLLKAKGVEHLPVFTG